MPASADGTSSGGSTTTQGSASAGTGTSTSTDESATASASMGGTTLAESDTSGSSSSEDGSTSSGSAGSSSSGSTTDGQANVEYSAIALPGGLDRIRIHKANLDADTCTWLVLVAPAMPGSDPGLEVPAGWSVETVAINDVAAACASGNPAMFGAEAALEAVGSVEFGKLGGTDIYPCTVDIDATFDFQGLTPGIPPTDTMSSSEIAVTGC